MKYDYSSLLFCCCCFSCLWNMLHIGSGDFSQGNGGRATSGGRNTGDTIINVNEERYINLLHCVVILLVLFQVVQCYTGGLIVVNLEAKAKAKTTKANANVNANNGANGKAKAKTTKANANVNANNGANGNANNGDDNGANGNGDDNGKNQQQNTRAKLIHKFKQKLNNSGATGRHLIRRLKKVPA